MPSGGQQDTKNAINLFQRNDPHREQETMRIESSSEQRTSTKSWVGRALVARHGNFMAPVWENGVLDTHLYAPD